MAWTIHTWGKAVDDEIEALPRDIQARLERFRLEIEKYGPMSLPRQHARYLGESLWELRLMGRDGIARVIYIVAQEQKMILLRAFVKKTQKTPPAEISLARKRARSLIL